MKKSPNVQHSGPTNGSLEPREEAPVLGEIRAEVNADPEARRVYDEAYRAFVGLVLEEQGAVAPTTEQ